MRKTVIITSIFIFLATNCLQAQTKPALYEAVDKEQMNRWVDSVFNRLSLDEKIGQLFMMTVSPDASARPLVERYINEMKLGGLLFSSGNAVEESRNLNYYQNLSKVPLFVSFDGEWGLSMRLDNTPRFPKNMMLGAIEDNELIYRYGEEMGRECREVGVHINFAPVLDINVNPENPVIGTRSFGEKRELVAEKGIAYAKGLESQNIIAVGKHFPGHGDTSDDSHKTLPLIKHDKKRLEEIELYPFKRFIESGFAGIMTGHLAVPALDKTANRPTSLSSLVVNDLLKKKLGFEGLAFTDALAMKGATAVKGSVCVRALLAGNDVLLNAAKPFNEFKLVKKAVQDGFISRALIEEKCIKILRYKYIAGLNNYKPIQLLGLENRINTDYALHLTDELNKAAITLLKNHKNLIPFQILERSKIAVVSTGSDTIPEFQNRIMRYCDFVMFNIPSNADAQTVDSIAEQLKFYKEIIISIHAERPLPFDISPLAEGKEVHLCFCISPYSIAQYQALVEAAFSVTLAYENTNGAQNAAAEVILGGIGAKGRLPVTITGLFEQNHGIFTRANKLSFF